jgi:hypothetical protein
MDLHRDTPLASNPGATVTDGRGEIAGTIMTMILRLGKVFEHHSQPGPDLIDAVRARTNQCVSSPLMSAEKVALESALCVYPLLRRP